MKNLLIRADRVNVCFCQNQDKTIAHLFSILGISDNFTPKNLYLHAMKEGIKNFFRRLTLQELNYLSYTYYYSSFNKILNHFFSCIQNGLGSPVNLNDQLSVLKNIDDVYRMCGVVINE